MEDNVIAVQRWINEHHQSLIVCPYQPGALVLSRTACIKRHLAARGETYEDMMTLDLFRFRVKKGLYICLNCPIGRSLTARAGYDLEVSPQAPMLQARAHLDVASERT